MKTLTAFFMAMALLGLSVSCDNRGDGGLQREEEAPIIDEAGDDIEETGNELEDKMED